MDNTMRHFSEILDQLIENNKFFAFYFQNPYCLENDEELSEYFTAPRGICLSCGATRGALIDSSWDEIVKFDLDDYWAETSPCEIEDTIYKAAIAAKLDKCFVPVRYLGTYIKTIKAYPQNFLDYDGDESWDLTEEGFLDRISELNYDEDDMREVTIKLPLYAYEKANSIGFTSDEYEDDELNIAASYDSPLMERVEEVAASFVHEYGETLYAELSSFLREWNVNDLHCGNVGWIGRRFVLIDYAGYHN